MALPAVFMTAVLGVLSQAPSASTCRPVFSQSRYEPSLPAAYLDRESRRLASTAPVIVMQRSGRLGQSNYGVLVYKPRQDSPTVTIDGAATVRSRNQPETMHAWTFTSTCASEQAMDGLTTVFEWISRLPDSVGLEQRPLYPRIQPSPDADPSVRHPVDVAVPTSLTVVRGTGTASVDLDRATMETAHVTVGANMLTGVQREEYVYPEGQPRPAQGALGLHAGLEIGGSHVRTVTLDGTQRYVVEIVLTIFETAEPPQHMWNPRASSYHVLWTRTLRAVVQ
jgi:hypothetical protein